ncbi:probable G-protein coupled receptor 156 [Pezoporus wallicus]|uniref:probable G-protein coupled receptor 156 isoform X2 n=1 Tax=Pezoporus flaviventris TaxID=889875 RepID=UPI00254F5C1B|nr:probable G-protein coupled receptor 156 [Pezoporus wallicus]XP_057272010.1 probable G-protein coupled receptor 156 [Pezoporus wallicus]XP_057272011.1 probable G-protein coupled receptor 156 [Pezoporus wallicus]XP_061310219.1 probable G-protein coupled receptor 156 isoform X2 [Pezoporus flaviventris]
MEPGFNCSQLCNGSSSFGSQEQHQQALQELCTVTVTSSDRSGKSSPSFSAALLGVVWTFLTGGVLLALFFLVFTIRFRKNRIVKMSSPNLNIVTLLGSGLTYTSAYLFGIQEQSLPSGDSVEKLIQVRLCLLCVGTSLVFGPVLGKSWRLYRVFTQRVPDKRVIIKDLQLLAMVAALVLVDAVLLLTWVFSDPVQCFRSLSVSLRATEKGMTCSVSRVQSCASLYSDLWLVLILGFKSILLLYGTYLAGLTDNVSSPPVNQSLTLIVGVNLVFLAASTVCLVHRFFRAWHNLLFGFTSGGIFVCTTTINCFIFVPQLRQWKAFEEESQTTSHMAKYFTSPSRSCRSVYSEEQLYQLIGEKNSMKRLLTEKNAVIESLQEQVSSAKEKLMRLMSAESGCDPRAMPPAPCTGSTGQCGDIQGDCCPPDAERDGWQPPCLLGTSPLCSNAQDLQKHASHGSHEPVCSRVMIFDNRDEVECGLEDVQQCRTPMGQGQPSEQLLDQDISAGVAWESSPKVSYVSSEKLREILQDLSLDGKTCSPALPGGLPHGSQGPLGEQEGMWGTQEGYLGSHTPFSPYLARRRRRIPLSPVSARCHGHVSPCGGKEASVWGCGESTHISLGREGDTAGRGLLHPPAASPPATSGEPCLQPEGWPGWPESQGSLCILREQRRRQGTLRGPAEPSLRSLYYYPDSDSSSSSSSEEMFHGCHRPCCEVCFQSPRGSLGSSSTDTDTEPSSCTGHRTQHQSGPQPVVNFKEDLKPTFV